MNAVKVNEMEYEGRKIHAPGLNELLSNINLWNERNLDRQEHYERKVIKKGKRLFTIIKTKG